MKIKELLSAVSVVLASIFCISCALPVGSYKKVSIEAVRMDEHGKEVARIESVDKYRKWQYWFSPDGPGRKTYFVRSDVYLVRNNERIKIDFLPVVASSNVYYSNFFPLNNSELWVALGTRSLFEKDWTEIDIVKFDKESVIDIATIQDCRVELVDGSRKSKWEQVGDTLQFETKQGTMLFNLSDGQLKK